MKKTHSRSCRYSTERVKKILDKSKTQWLSSLLIEQNKCLTSHKCDYVRLPKVTSHMDRLSIQEFQRPKFKHRQRKISSAGNHRMPLNALNRFLSSQTKKHQEGFSGRNIRRKFREYLLASKQLKKISSHDAPNPKKYQIALLKENQGDDKLKEHWHIDWMPLKMEERHFLMGHTVKHP